MTTDSLRIESHREISVLRMQRAKANALDREFCNALIDALDEIARSSSRAAVLTGHGSIFSAGVDLLRLLDAGEQYVEAFVPMISKLVHALFTFPKPMVAAVNGHAIAGGCVMACAADHRLMANGSGRIGVPELIVGVPFPTAALEMVRFVVPPQHLQAVIYRGVTYAPEDARAVGLIDEVVDADALLERALAGATRLAALPTDAFSLTKRQVRAPILARIEAGKARDREVEALWTHADTLATIRRYVESTFKPR
jgi:enoyl-CoA hydratase